MSEGDLQYTNLVQDLKSHSIKYFLGDEPMVLHLIIQVTQMLFYNHGMNIERPAINDTGFYKKRKMKVQQKFWFLSLSVYWYTCNPQAKLEQLSEQARW